MSALLMEDSSVEGSIAERLAHALYRSGLNQSDVARRLAGDRADQRRVESCRRLLLKWLQGRHAPSAEHALSLARIFEVPDDFFDASTLARDDRPGAVPAADLDLIDFAQQVVARTNVSAVPQPSDTLSREAIAELVPRFNANQILLDSAQVDPGKSVVAKAGFKDKWNLGYWYEGTAVVPAVMQLEAIAQAAAVMVLTLPHNYSRIAVAGGFDKVRFKRPLEMTQTISIECTHKHSTGPIVHVSAVARIADVPDTTDAGKITARGDIVLVVQ
jgi:3-hydroxyacyl-[acyl-carrier-protein] dehydratase